MRLRGKFGTILTIVAGVGMVITIVLTAKKAPEAQKMKEAALELKKQETGDENAQLTTIESVKAQAVCYIPVALTAAATVGSLIGSQIVPQSALRDLEKLHQTYKDISAKLNGPKASQIMDQMVEQQLKHGNAEYPKATYVLKFDGKDIPFEATLPEVLTAEFNVNRFFIGTGSITFNEMLQIFHQKGIGDEADIVGWNDYLGEKWYGYCWIDFVHREGKLNGKPVIFIDMPFECHSLCEDEEELVNHGIEGVISHPVEVLA